MCKALPKGQRAWRQKEKVAESRSGPGNIKGDPVLVSSSFTCSILPHSVALGLLAIFEHMKWRKPLHWGLGVNTVLWWGSISLRSFSGWPLLFIQDLLSSSVISSGRPFQSNLSLFSSHFPTYCCFIYFMPLMCISNYLISAIVMYLLLVPPTNRTLLYFQSLQQCLAPKRLAIGIFEYMFVSGITTLCIDIANSLWYLF